MKIEAYRRSKVLEIDLMGETVKFMPVDGKFVADIKKEAIYRRLLEIPDAYRVLGATVGPVDDGNDDDDTSMPGDAASPYILTQEGEGGVEETIDLRELDREALEKFMADNDIPKLPRNSKDQTLRDKIVAFFKVD